MTILKCLMTKNRWYRPGSTIPMQGIVVHSTGANNPELRRYVQPSEDDLEYEQLMKKLGRNQYDNHWNRPQEPYGMHAWVGQAADGEVLAVQTLPWDHFLWGCGSGSKGSYNGTHIQFEICENTADIKYTTKAYRAAVELCAELCENFKIPINKIVSHNEAHKLGYASAHGDPEHWWLMAGYTMDGFRLDVLRVLDGGDWEVDEVRYDKLENMPAWAKPTVEKLINKGLLNGTGAGLDLSQDMLRILVIQDRAGVFD